jgi:hypothetical protein
MSQTFFVCAMADDAVSVLGSSYDRKCSQCQARVMVAPSGQRALLANPSFVILCLRCFKALPPEEVNLAPSPISDSEIIREMWDTRPNLRRSRN